MLRKVIPAGFALIVLTGASTAAEAQRRPRPPEPPRTEQEQSPTRERENPRARPSQERGRDATVPRQYMPPPGMCRIWLDGVPPGQQPAPTDCPTAIRKRPPNGRVIFGERKADDRRDEVQLRRDLRGRPPSFPLRIPGS